MFSELKGAVRQPYDELAADFVEFARSKGHTMNYVVRSLPNELIVVPVFDQEADPPVVCLLAKWAHLMPPKL